MLRKVKYTGEPKSLASLSAPTGTNQWTKVGTFSVFDPTLYNSVFVQYDNLTAVSVPLTGQAVQAIQFESNSYYLFCSIKCVVNGFDIEVYVKNDNRTGWAYSNGKAELC